LDEEDAVKHVKSIAIGVALLSLAPLGCGTSNDAGPLGNVNALIVLQRAARNDDGNVFSYTSYIPGAHLLKLSPPTAAGTITPICCDQQPELAGMDIQSYDLSFDATQIVFSGHSAMDSNYGIYLLDLTTGVVTSVAGDPGRDYVYPIFLPGNKILFETNDVVSNPVTDPMPPQHEDEYERATTAQVGTVNVDGTGLQLGPRNLSHRVMPSLASDGRVIFTQWDHLGEENQGDLMFMNTDMTELREAFGKEGDSASNSTLKAREIAPGRMIAIATARDRTVQAGAIIDVRLGMPSESDGVLRADSMMSEANATFVNVTPDVPVDNSPSSNTIGRYYDAFPLDQSEHPQLLVSWADGPVETEVLSAAGLNAEFGIYLYDTATLERHPIMQDPGMWDIFARPLQAHAAPAVTASEIDNSIGQQALIGAMNVYTSTLHDFTPGSIYGVRVMEGYSSEEGFPEMFGTTMFEGHADLGVAPVSSDGSWLAHVPANVPLHLQTVDKFGMSLFNEPVWVSSRAGESRVCGGCHENRATSTVINPGITEAAAMGPMDAMGMVPRSARMTASADLLNPNLIGTDGSGLGKLISIGWGGADPNAGATGAVQQVFTDNCVSCHGPDNKAGIPGYTITNQMGQVVLNWTFNLSAAPVTVNYGPATDNGPAMQTFSASYFTMAGPDMEAIEKNNLIITGNFKVYMNPEDAAGSLVIQKVNPTQLFPVPNASVRAFTTAPHSQTPGGYDSGRELTATEFYKLILAADMGVNYYSRDNNPRVNAN
jgi:mono/diheme cytochrome c family protein